MNTLGAEGQTSSVTLNNAALTQPAGAWVGAMVHLATGQEWVDQVGMVTASAPGSITVSYQQETASQVPRAGNRFYHRRGRRRRWIQPANGIAIRAPAC